MHYVAVAESMPATKFRPTSFMTFFEQQPGSWMIFGVVGLGGWKKLHDSYPEISDGYF